MAPKVMVSYEAWPTSERRQGEERISDWESRENWEEMIKDVVEIGIQGDKSPDQSPERKRVLPTKRHLTLSSPNMISPKKKKIPSSKVGGGVKKTLGRWHAAKPVEVKELSMGMDVERAEDYRGYHGELIVRGAIDSEEIKEKNNEQDGYRKTMIPQTGESARRIEILQKELENVGSRLVNKEFEIKGKEDKKVWKEIQSLF